MRNIRQETTTMALFSLTFVRHGETLHNRKNIIQGQLDIPLSSLGEKQAELVASRLQRERFTHIFASDLSRAHQTAKIISDANKVCRSEIILDRRLRERKFGTAEGKSSKELLLAAKKAKRKYIEYTPPGAESVSQVQERAQQFFKDLCKLCLSLSDEDDVSYTPARIKRRHGGSLGRNSRHSKRLQTSGRSQSFCGSGNIQNIINEINLVQDLEDDDSGNDMSEDISFCQSKNYITMQGSESCDTDTKVIGEYQYRECFPSSSDDSNMSGDLKIKGSLVRSKSQCSEVDSDHVSHSSMERNGSESDSTLSDSKFMPYSESCEIQNDSGQRGIHTFSQTPESLTVTELNSNSPSYGCPNVSLSLSPTGQPFSSISSISSGRNSSFDELDGLPTTVADILVVSHGGFIKESMKFFVDNLDCKVPGMKGHALKVCPNCSVSKFTVTVDEMTEKPTVTCITIHDKDHLIGLEMPEAKGAY